MTVVFSLTPTPSYGRFQGKLYTFLLQMSVLLTSLTLSQMTNFGLVQTERACRRQFQI